MGVRPTIHPSLESTDEIKESLEIGLRRRGDPLDGWVTFRDLDSAGIIDGRGVGRGALVVRPGPSIGGPGGPGGAGPIPPPDFGENDLTRPPAATNVRARGMSNTSIGVAWNPPGYNNHAYTEVFASFQSSWAVVAESFNAQAPVGPGNNSPFFMGRAAGTSFLHTNLGSTIPAANFSRAIIDLIPSSTGFTARIDGDQRQFAPAGTQVYLSSDEPWQGNGTQGQVSAVTFFGGITNVAVQSPPVEGAPAAINLVAVPDEDDLVAALNPRTIYYWVRFVSTARIAGPVQSEQGAPGQVMINSAEVLNILTGRIRSSQLANDLLAPINFIRGPVTEVDEQGNRRFPTVRDFVLAQGDAILTEYDEVVQQIYLGSINPADSPWPGAAQAATLTFQIQGEVTENSAYIGTLQTLQAAFEEVTAEGVEQIISTLMERRLVSADDQGALSYLANTLQIDTPDGGLLLNEVAQRIFTNRDRIENAFTVRLQADQNGILTTAGFGIGLEGEVGGDLVSTFAVSADQFAIMGAGTRGRRVSSVQGQNNNRIRINVVGSDLTALRNDFPQDTAVALSIPSGNAIWQSQLRGRSLRVAQQPSSDAGGLFVLLQPADGTIPNVGFVPVQERGVALLREASIPFIVDTATSTVGIRGRLIVDGMINTQELEVTRLLRANEVWAQSITNFGLIRTSSLVGETIATPRFGGWAVKMTNPDLSFNNRIFEYSRWQTTTDALPDPDLADMNNLQGLYPQLGSNPPQDSAFWINAQGRVFVRASLQVGGNARILTLDPQNIGTSRYFIQNDNEFPLMIYPFDRVGEAGQNWNNPEQQWNYTANARAAVRRNALFWVNRDGTAGFNTRNSAIFVGDTPMEPPSGSGYITVQTRLAEGQWTGLGRVLVSATFGAINDQFTLGPSALFGCTFALFLASASVGYGVTPVNGASFRLPSQNNGTGNNNLGSSQLAFLDQHALIIRGTGGGADPGLAAYQAWQQVHQGTLFKLAEIFDGNNGGRTLSGTARDIPAGNYKLLIVIVERFLSTGGPVLPSTPGRTLPYSLSPSVSQVSTTPYNGPVSANGTFSPPPTPPNNPPPPVGPGGGDFTPPIVVP